MAIKVHWLGHNCWSIITGGKTLLLDPFLNDSPTAPVKADGVAADYILVSHGHFDHISDAAAIANRTGTRSSPTSKSASGWASRESRRPSR